jgi:6-phosphogluconate dehydrogenase
MQLGMIGLGRMGGGMVTRLIRGGHSCVVFDRNAKAVEDMAKQGARGVTSLAEFVGALSTPRVIWIMVPAAVVDATLDDLAPLITSGDIVIDGGNSYYVDDLRRARALAARGIHYVDAGVSGGVWGADNGYCLMTGGDTDAVKRIEPILRTLAPGIAGAPPTPGRNDNASTAAQGYLHCGASGAGHFVKMVHNGIEYALMGAYAEGFNILAHANAGKQTRVPATAGHPNEVANAETTPLREPERFAYDLPVAEIAELWRRGSVVRSWLLDLTAAALAEHPDLAPFAGHVSDSGEGRWTALAAIESGAPAPLITAALFDRFSSRGEDDFAHRLLSAMRLQFGGHVERKR